MTTKELLLKKLLHRSLNMGCKEMDIIMGNFAAKHLQSFSEKELLIYEEILKINDATLYQFISSNKEDIHEGFDAELLTMLQRIKATYN